MRIIAPLKNSLRAFIDTIREKDRFVASVKVGFSGLVFLAVAMSIAGCGQRHERVRVSGHVLLDGKPLAKGEITFAPLGKRAAFATLDAEGRFQLTTYEMGDGTSLGTHPVSVHSGEFLDPSHKLWRVPKKYASLTTSGLSVSVDGPTDAIVINLTWDGGKPFVETIQGGE